jgi:hypothetical protein
VAEDKAVPFLCAGGLRECPGPNRTAPLEVGFIGIAGRRLVGTRFYSIWLTKTSAGLEGLSGATAETYMPVENQNYFRFHAW